MDTKKTSKENRRVWWILCALSIVMVAVSGISLARRIANYNETTDHPLFAYIQATSTSFTFAGKPIEIVEDTIDGQDVVRIKYGDQELVLDVAIPPLQPLPELYERHQDWLTISLFADRSGLSMKEFQRQIESDQIKPRLGIVTRTPFGLERLEEPNHENLQQEENWGYGQIRSDVARYDCYELLRDGTITHEIKRHPESGSSLQRRQNYAKLKGEPIPQRRADELQEYTWQYGAALKVMARAPAITLERQALTVAGWTLPATAAGFLLLLVSFFFAIAPPKTAQ
ncbi:MAG: hypothetical protein JKX70_10175 [Phycisphaerales bacterium]|nr:hypothetical protein [Phycisphaerales bacterium]